MKNATKPTKKLVKKTYNYGKSTVKKSVGLGKELMNYPFNVMKKGPVKSTTKLATNTVKTAGNAAVGLVKLGENLVLLPITTINELTKKKTKSKKVSKKK